jgi:hypothetical protein
MKKKAICAVMLALLLALCSACQEEPQLPEGPSIAPIADENGKLPKHVTRELNENIRLDADIEVPEGFDMNRGRILAAVPLPMDQQFLYKQFLEEKQATLWDEDGAVFPDFGRRNVYIFGDGGESYIYERGKFTYRASRRVSDIVSCCYLSPYNEGNGWKPIEDIYPQQGDLSFMSMEESIQIVKSVIHSLGDLGGAEVKLKQSYVGTLDVLEKQWTTNEQNPWVFTKEDEGYFFQFYQWAGDLNVADYLVSRNSEVSPKNTFCPSATAYVDCNGISYFDLEAILRLTGVQQEGINLSSLEQAVAVVEKTFQELALDDNACKPYTVTKIELLYVPFYRDQNRSFLELRPCWSFSIDYLETFGERETPISDVVYTDFCLIDAVTGLKL